MQDWDNEDFKSLHGANPALNPTSTPEYQKLVKSVQEVFDATCLFHTRAAELRNMKDGKQRERGVRDLEKNVMRYTNNLCKAITPTIAKIHFAILALRREVNETVVEAHVLELCNDIFRRMCILCCGMIDMSLTEEEKKAKHEEIRNWLAVKMENMRIEKSNSDSGEIKELPPVTDTHNTINVPKLIERTLKGEIGPIPEYNKETVQKDESPKDLCQYFIEQYITTVKVHMIGCIIMQAHNAFWTTSDKDLTQRVKESIGLFNKTFAPFIMKYEMRFTPESYVLMSHIDRLNTGNLIIPDDNNCMFEKPVPKVTLDAPNEDDYDTIPDDNEVIF